MSQTYHDHSGRRWRPATTPDRTGMCSVPVGGGEGGRGGGGEGGRGGGGEGGRGGRGRGDVNRSTFIQRWAGTCTLLIAIILVLPQFRES